MRLIDADELMLHLTTCLQNGMPLSNSCDINDVIYYVESMQTIEPEQKKGKWIEPDEEEAFLFGGHTFIPPLKCSECGRTALNEPWTFCPNCGAKMEGNL